MVIIAFGLLGMAGLQMRMQSSEMEAYQGQALLLLNDMANRISSNRTNAAAYLAGGGESTRGRPARPRRPRWRSGIWASGVTPCRAPGRSRRLEGRSHGRRCRLRRERGRRLPHHRRLARAHAHLRAARFSGLRANNYNGPAGPVHQRPVPAYGDYRGSDRDAMKQPARHHQAGFTLVELMVSMVLGLADRAGPRSLCLSTSIGTTAS